MDSAALSLGFHQVEAPWTRASKINKIPDLIAGTAATPGVYRQFKLRNMLPK